MTAFVYTLTTVAALVGQFDPAPACDGPNCRHNHNTLSGNSRPQFGPVDAGPRYSPFNRDSRAVDCGCTTCDPSRPCSPGNCQRQGCADCDHSLTTGRVIWSSDRAPAVAQPAFNDVPVRSMPRPQARVQKLCPVTGEELGSMGPPITVTVMGRTLQVCCDSCVSAVRRNPQKYLRQVDADLASNNDVPPPSDEFSRVPAGVSRQPTRRSQQKRCPVTGEELGSMGPPVAVNVNGKTIYVCCQACVNAVRRNPEKYLQLIDEEPDTLPVTNPRSSVRPRALF